MASEAAISVKTGRGGGGRGGARDDPGPASPRSCKMKFLCSHGGRILPRPIDGHLKYVGGETRVVAVSRDVNYSDLMRKLTEQFPGDVVLKYQLLSEDLDTLVSVRADEDLKHMIDEYDRHENEGTPKLRTFLFPAKPIIAESHLALTDANALEQRYIDAINGITRTTIKRRRASTTANSVSSNCPSPKSNSPDGHTIDSMAHDVMLSNAYHYSPATPESAVPKRVHSMYKVHSSPSLYNLGNTQSSPHSNNHSNIPSPQSGNHSMAQNNGINNYQIQPHNYYQNHPQQQQQQHYHHVPGYQSPPVRVTPDPPVRVSPDPHKGALPPWMVPVASMDRPEMSRFYVGQGQNYYYPPNVPQKWNGVGGNKYYDDGPYSVSPEVRSRAQSPLT